MAIRLNVKKVLADKAKRDAEVKPLPKVRMASNTSARKPTVSVRKPEPAIGKPALQQRTINNQQPLFQLQELETEMAQIRKLRAIQSTRTADLVRHIHEQLAQQHPEAAQQFMKGNLPHEELEAHASMLDGYTKQMSALLDEIRYVEQHGVRPTKTELVKALGEVSEDVAVINNELTRLKDRIHKTSKKLRLNPNAKADKVAEWNLKLALDEARREELKHKKHRITQQRNG